MDFNEYQKLASETAIYPNKGNNIEYPTLGLAGEAGEICNIVKKIQRDSVGIITEESREKLLYEVGDLLWYCAALAYELGLSLDYIAKANLAKLKSRKERGVLGGSGDKR